MANDGSMGSVSGGTAKKRRECTHRQEVVSESCGMVGGRRRHQVSVCGALSVPSVEVQKSLCQEAAAIAINSSHRREIAGGGGGGGQPNRSGAEWERCGLDDESIGHTLEDVLLKEIGVTMKNGFEVPVMLYDIQAEEEVKTADEVVL